MFDNFIVQAVGFYILGFVIVAIPVMVSSVVGFFLQLMRGKFF